MDSDNQPSDDAAASPLADGAAEAVLRFLPVFDDPSFVPAIERGGADDGSGVIEWPWYEYAPAVLDFQQTLYDTGWIVSFDWPEWQAEAAELVRSDGVEFADFETLRRLLTVIIRKDRFCEGTLTAAFDEGLVHRVLRRIARLNGTESASA